MALYSYKALNMAGKRVKGKKEALDQDDLYNQLRKEQLYLVFCETEATQIHRRKPMNLKELSTFCRELGTMLESGMDILTVLEVLIDGAARKDIKDTLIEVRDDLHNGKLFSDALEDQGKFFPTMMVHMFKAGEASGRLAQVSMTMSQQFDKENKIQRKVKTAMIYPSILGVISVVVVLAIFVIIMPSFADVFEGTELPWITGVMMSMSNFIINNSISFIGVVLAIIVAFIVAFKHPKVQRKWAEVQVNLPKVGHLIRIVYTSRFARSLSSLYISGVNIITALELTASTINNIYIEEQIKDASVKLREGRALSSVIGEVKGMDFKLVKSISVGEESGKLDSILNSLSDEYDDDAAQAIEQMLALMEPMLIVVLGGVVAVIVISVLLPIYSMYNSF